MRHSIVHVLGPAGSGKSHLVRRVMSGYTGLKVVDGGVGGLPLGYKMTTADASLLVLGNYEEDVGRARHGMTQFNRFRKDFDRALAKAKAVSANMPVLYEG